MLTVEQPSRASRKPSKLRAMPVVERMLTVLPRIGLASDGQLEHVASVYPEGGQRAMQALMNMMACGVKDCVSWSRDCWQPDAVGRITGSEDDNLDLNEAIPLPPTAGSTLVNTELCLETMFNRVRQSLHQVIHEAMGAHTTSTPESVLELVSSTLPRQVILLLRRVRFTLEVEHCVRERRQIGTVMRPYATIQAALGERQIQKDLPEKEAATLMALQTLLHEQQMVMQKLMEHKEADTLDTLWKEQARFYHRTPECRDATPFTELVIDDLTAPIGYEYDASPMMITTEFTQTLRWAYLYEMLDASVESKRVLVLVGPPASGKMGMLHNMGQLLGTQSTTIRCSETTPSDDEWWRRQLTAVKKTSGGRMAPLILARAHTAPEAALQTAVSVASEHDIALCLTMSPGPAANSRCAGVLAGLTTITMPPIDLEALAVGQLAAEGVPQSAELAKELATILATLDRDGSKQLHYDFGPRTLMQLCTQIGVDRRPSIPDAVTILTVVQRCLAPKLIPADLQMLKQLIIDQGWKKEKDFKEGELTPASLRKDGRWYNIAEEIGSITKIEPDCFVLPVPPANEAAFFEDFCKYLNRNTYSLVRVPGTLSEMTPEQLLGTMPRKGEEVQDGLLISILRQAMEDHPDENEMVWIAMMTGPCNPSVNFLWEALHELLNDSGCISLSTGEQLRLASNLRFLFIMPEAGATDVDTFSRTAVVYSDP
jgi:ABC-type cobalamin/Fe3+-siderophores transport system ATPase subunit